MEKTYKRASNGNACVNFFLGCVKSVPNFMLFCCIRELCPNFGFFGVILMANNLVIFKTFTLKKGTHLNDTYFLPLQMSGSTILLILVVKYILLCFVAN